jgi:hypothetical protein
MAKRPVFIAKNVFPYFEIQEMEFQYHSGFAVSQKQKSIKELHTIYAEKCPGKKILEISTKSTEGEGISLSAFNLTVNINGKDIPIECAYQGSKKFENGGPFTDLYSRTPWEAKKDSRLKECGEIKEFILDGEHYCTEPMDFFYNWIYIRELMKNNELIYKLKEYSAFTDIEFNPKKSFNCQAKAVAIAVGLMQAGKLGESVQSKEDFLCVVYGKEKFKVFEQISIFDLLM